MGHTTAIRSSAGVALALLATVQPLFGDDPQNTDWSLLGNAHEMQHHARLSQINTDTVGFTSYSSVPRSRSRPRLLAFALDGSAPAPPWAEIPHIPAPPTARLDATLASAGKDIFVAYGCDGCHGHGGVAVWETLDLRVRPPANLQYLQTVLGGALAARGMPVFEMADDTAEALRAYLVNLAWDAHEAQDEASGD